MSNLTTIIIYYTIPSPSNPQALTTLNCIIAMSILSGDILPRQPGEQEPAGTGAAGGGH